MWNIFRKNKVGLVLGGGGARGFFHVGVIKGLQALGVKIDAIAGTSIGSVVGAIWAANPDVDLEKISKELDFVKIVHMMRSADQIKKYLREFIQAETFEDLKIKLKFNATDINNRQEVVFDHGDLFPGLIASIAIPGLFKPVECQGRYLVDGGVVNNVPASLLENVSELIISDITGPIKNIHAHSVGIDVLYSAVALMQQNISLEKIRSLNYKKITYLHLDDKVTSIMDFRKKNYQGLIDQGYEAVMKSLSLPI